MELLEFKHKIFELCRVKNIKGVRDVLYNAVIKNDIALFDRYNLIVDDKKDWLQALWQYYEADRTEKKQDLLNTMQNKYLAELRDALLPDLMSGKLAVSNVPIETEGDT